MRAATLDGWPHLFLPGSGEGPILLMLHGTGSTEQQVAPLATALGATADVLAPRGRVTENGMLRWFRRFGEGVFDFDSVTEEAAALAGFIEEARVTYQLGSRPIIAVGVSNGANIALATALLHPSAISRVIAFSGMHPLPAGPADQDLAGLRVLLLNGADDPLAPADSVSELERSLQAAHAQVDRITRPGGHGVTQSEIEAAQRWLDE
jgi:phospholipase/carboxylesterase